MIKNIIDEAKIFQKFISNPRNLFSCVNALENVRYLDFYTDEQKYEFIKTDFEKIGEKKLAEALIVYFEYKKKGGLQDETR